MRTVLRDCLIFNAWSADSFRGEPLHGRRGPQGDPRQGDLYFKRHYADGSTRPVRLNVNDFVGVHVDRKSARSTPVTGP